ncbi:unnamed protein product [Pieris macdunnoughi]|uniref:Uncharacterized protein n=1 Tax=Pieris macdunnoughi TaxID=345717 RepID=A0A821WHD0_9NEOP|nr:unnamed protein product [Pieris macdunnoughi]
MDDVLEILVENGELPPSAVGDVASNRSIDTGYLTASPGDFTPTDVLTDDVLSDSHVRESLAADELQRELNEIQNEIMGHDLSTVGDIERVDGIDDDLNVDMLATNEFNANFADCNTTSDNDFLSLLTDSDETHGMDIDDEQTERMSIPALTNGDILDTSRTDFPDINDLSLPFHNEDTRHDTFEDRCDFDFKEFDLGNSVNMDTDYYMNNNFPNLFGRGHMPQCDPLLGGILSRPAPRPACKIYSWEKSEYDAT